MKISKKKKLNSWVVNKFYQFVFLGEEPGVVVDKPYIDSHEQHRFLLQNASKALSYLFNLLKVTLLIKENLQLIYKKFKASENFINTFLRRRKLFGIKSTNGRPQQLKNSQNSFKIYILFNF